MISKKAAIGLSINMIVIVIISLVVMGLGITMLYQLVGNAVQQQEGISQKTNAELERLMSDQGKKVAVPFSVASVNRGDAHVFGLGIANIGGVGNSFNIKVEFVDVVNEQEQVITKEDYRQYVSNWVLYNVDNINIEEQEHHKEPILFDVPKNAVKGQHSFNIRVYTGTEQYGNTQKVYLDVK